jgi:hypothetical protein
MFIVSSFDWYEVSTRSRNGDGTDPTRRPIAHPSCPNQKPSLDADKNAPETPAHVPSVCVTHSARQDRQVTLTTAWQPAALASGLRPLKQCFIDAKNRPLDKRPARKERNKTKEADGRMRGNPSH